MRRVPPVARFTGEGPGEESLASGHSGQSVPKTKRHIHQERPRTGVCPGMDDKGPVMLGLKYKAPSKWFETRDDFSVLVAEFALNEGCDREHARARERMKTPNPYFAVVFKTVLSPDYFFYARCCDSFTIGNLPYFQRPYTLLIMTKCLLTLN